MKQKEYLYLSIYNELLHDIESGKYAPGDRIPSELELSQKHFVSRITSKKALDMLVEQGFITRKAGKGTFVKPNFPQIPEAAPSTFLSQNKCKVQHNKIIGLILERVDDSFGLAFLSEVYKYSYEKGYRLCVCFSFGDHEKEKEDINFLINNGALGIIVMPVHCEHFSAEILKLVIDGYPLVLFDRYFPGVAASFVASDNRAGAYKLTCELIGKGHTNIAFISTESDVTTIQERINGFQQACEDAELYESKKNIFKFILGTMPFRDSPENRAHDYEQLKSFLCENEITGFVAVEYSIASLIKSVLKNLGKSIPEDASVVCFDETYDYLGNFFFTHVKQDETALAKYVIDCIINIISSEDPAKFLNEVKVEPVFKDGQSVGFAKSKLRAILS